MTRINDNGLQVPSLGHPTIIAHHAGFGAGDKTFDLDWVAYERIVFEFTIDGGLALRSNAAFTVEGLQMSSAGGPQSDLHIAAAANTLQQITPGMTTGRLVVSRGLMQNSLMFVNRVSDTEHIAFQGFLIGINNAVATQLMFRGGAGWVDITVEGLPR